jgi:CheY-like chemotaxis protein/anti-sigma regulatory factor (Ser/Thr protein kinase)
LHELIQETITLMRNAASGKGLSLDTRESRPLESHPGVFIGDGPRIRQILLNLIGNAIKFTERGGVEVVVTGIERSFSLRSGKRDRVTIEVRDTGIGIAPEALDLIFEKFSQADTSSSRDFGGTGLGLSICRSLIESMHGSIEVESKPGVGSVFRFEILLSPAETREDTGEVFLSQPMGMNGTRVLVVDDDIHNRRILKENLRKVGCVVDEAVSGRTALRAAARDRFDLIFMDIQMPGLDGFETTRRLRALEARAGLARVPVVALTAHAIAGYESLCVDAGMQGYLTKPLRGDLLHEMLSRYARAAAPQN